MGYPTPASIIDSSARCRSPLKRSTPSTDHGHQLFLSDGEGDRGDRRVALCADSDYPATPVLATGQTGIVSRTPGLLDPRTRRSGRLRAMTRFVTSLPPAGSRSPVTSMFAPEAPGRSESPIDFSTGLRPKPAFRPLPSHLNVVTCLRGANKLMLSW